MPDQEPTQQFKPDQELEQEPAQRFKPDQGIEISPEQLTRISKSSQKGRPSYEDSIDEQVIVTDRSGYLTFTHNGDPEELKPKPNSKPQTRQDIPKTKPRGASRYHIQHATRRSSTSTVSARTEGHMDIPSSTTRRGWQLKGFLNTVNNVKQLDKAIIKELQEHGLLDKEGNRIK